MADCENCQGTDVVIHHRDRKRLVSRVKLIWLCKNCQNGLPTVQIESHLIAYPYAILGAITILLAILILTLL